MKKASVVREAEYFVKRILAREGTGHDWWHIERVRNNARVICRSEKADWFIVELAVLLHDVGDRKVIQKEEDNHAGAEKFLKKHRLPERDISHIMYIIQNMSFSKSLDGKQGKFSSEFQIVQDADRLDALGAIGIARAFTFGGSKARPLYDPTVKTQRINTTKSYRKLNSSTVHHFEEKLFLLKDLMNTRTAKNIARRRHRLMKEYVKRFLEEWEGRR